MEHERAILNNTRTKIDTLFDYLRKIVPFGIVYVSHHFIGTLILSSNNLKVVISINNEKYECYYQNFLEIKVQRRITCLKVLLSRFI